MAQVSALTLRQAQGLIVRHLHEDEDDQRAKQKNQAELLRSGRHGQSGLSL
jgi:hypothetical protein